MNCHIDLPPFPPSSPSLFFIGADTKGTGGEGRPRDKDRGRGPSGKGKTSGERGCGGEVEERPRRRVQPR